MCVLVVGGDEREMRYFLIGLASMAPGARVVTVSHLSLFVSPPIRFQLSFLAFAVLLSTLPFLTLLSFVSFTSVKG